MSEQTIRGIEDAIRAHIADIDGLEPVVGDWFLAYAYMSHDPDADDGISHHSGYTATLRKPSRLRHDIRACGGLRGFLAAMVQKYGTLTPGVLEYGYGDRERWRIPDDPFDATSWLTSVHGQEAQQ